ncbi:hypothetical protein [Archangium sp.]|uniref:hypothetical protein n=1 Tax=Archangium sp. TaxID=1872627 RepID=UPI00286A8444|nr:hypothetical protein [Archangium sp.]
MRFVAPRWSHLLAAGLLLAGCKSNKEQQTAPSAPATKPAVPTAATITDATLSYLESAGEQKCRWVQHTPPGEPKALFTLPSHCDEVKLAWSMDGKEGLAYLPGPTEGEAPRAWRVELATGKGTALSRPPLGRVGAFGFDAKGHPLALMEDPREPVGEGDKREIQFEGKSYPAAMDGQPGLAHAFRLEGDSWKRFETKDTSFEWDYAAGVSALAAYDAMGPTPEKLSSSAMEAFKPVPEGSPVLAELNAIQQASDETGSWKQVELPGGPLYVWEASDGELPYLSAPVRIQGAKGLAEPEGLSVSGSLSLATRGEWVLVNSGGAETGPLARLWNAKTKKLVASLADKSTVTFWPKPSSTTP